eukprot:766393-Hanusia_phi.AAC.8
MDDQLQYLTSLSQWREKYKKLYEAVRKQGMEVRRLGCRNVCNCEKERRETKEQRGRPSHRRTAVCSILQRSGKSLRVAIRIVAERETAGEREGQRNSTADDKAEDANSELLQLVSRQEATVVSHRRASSPTEPPAQRRSSIAGSVISPPSSPARGRGFAYKMGSSMGSLVLQEEEMSIAEMEQEDQSPPRPSRNPLRPFSAMSRRSARMDAIPDDLQERREEEDDGLWLRSREETMDEATVSRIAELEEANRRMTVELKQMSEWRRSREEVEGSGDARGEAGRRRKREESNRLLLAENVMAISRGAADAYEAVVARLGATENGARSDEDEDEEVGELPERVKPGKSRSCPFLTSPQVSLFLVLHQQTLSSLMPLPHPPAPFLDDFPAGRVK